MRYRALEDELRKRLLRRRIIEGVLLAVCFFTGVVCSSLRESTKEVIVHEYGIIFGTYEEVIYNNAYVPFIVIGFIGALTAAVVLLSDLLACRFETVEVDGYHITVYRGMIGEVLYVDGEEKGRIEMYGHYLETSLPDGTVVTASFGRSMLDWCHLSFSNGHESIDL